MAMQASSSAVLKVLRRFSQTRASAYAQLLRQYTSDNANVLRGEGVSGLSTSFEASQEAMQQLLFRLEQLTNHACNGGGEQAMRRHKGRGKLPPRDRINCILDPGAPFLELSHLAGHGMYGMAPTGDAFHHDMEPCPSCQLLQAKWKVCHINLQIRQQRRQCLNAKHSQESEWVKQYTVHRSS